MSKEHAFSFDGGEELAKMGATWFITYAYFEVINKNENRWRHVKTYNSRRSMYRATSQYHQSWYAEASKMDTNRLNKNTLGVAGDEVKRMALELLAKA